VDLDCLKFFLISPNKTTRGHVSKLFVRHSCVDVWKYFLETGLLKFGKACQQQWMHLWRPQRSILNTTAIMLHVIISARVERLVIKLLIISNFLSGATVKGDCDDVIVWWWSNCLSVMSLLDAAVFADRHRNYNSVQSPRYHTQLITSSATATTTDCSRPRHRHQHHYHH